MLCVCVFVYVVSYVVVCSVFRSVVAVVVAVVGLLYVVRLWVAGSAKHGSNVGGGSLGEREERGE